ncbi:MAG: hypothetical protein EBU75_09925 [Betaproteobacteria bacterium]|nr:hypothetical protein [Betaproteobacteria bacterium]
MTNPPVCNSIDALSSLIERVDMAIKGTDFRHIQREGDNKTIRTDKPSKDAKGDGHSIHVSGKGFWGSVANFFRGIREWFSNRFEKNTYARDRDARAHQAYEAFKKVLTGMTGEQSAQRILEQVGSFQPERKAQTVSPDQVRRALEFAQSEIRLHNDQVITGLMPRQSQEQAGESFGELCKEAKIKNLEQFSALFTRSDSTKSGGALHVYSKMLQGMTEVFSRGQSKACTPEDVRAYAVVALGALRTLKSPEDVAKLGAVYESAQMQFEDLLVTLSNSRYDELQADWEGVSDAMANLMGALKTEDGQELGGDEATVFVNALMGNALTSLGPRQRDVLAIMNIDKHLPNQPTAALVKSFLDTWKPD